MAQTSLQLIKPRGNKLWPLPPDYATLTRDGQRQARVNACRQWLLPVDDIGREAKAEAKVASLRFFDYYYLYPDPSTDYNPMFYDDEPFPTPEAHNDMTRLGALERFVVGICPRGFAKSTRCRKETCLEMVSRPGWSTIYATSTHTNALGFGQACKEVLYENARIYDDWSPEYGVKLKPNRGEKSTSTQYFYLNNDSWLRTISASSRLRGGRPRRFKLDDPEYDESGSTSMSHLRAYMERLLFKLIGPMVSRPGTGVEWWATFVSKQHYAWLAMQVDQTGHAVDPRFDFWARLFVDAIVQNDDGSMASCWPELWPLTVADKQDLAKKTRNNRYLECESLEEMSKRLGPSIFNAEMRGQPGDAKDAFFGGLEKEKHGYWYEDEDATLNSSPWSSEASIVTYRDGKQEATSLLTFLTHARIFIVGDTSFTAGAASDPKALVCMAITADNELVILDVWARKCREEALVEETLKMANKWRAHSVHPEVVQKGFSYYLSLNSQLKTKASQLGGHAHIPRLEALKPPHNMSKEGKISGLLFRFEHGLIKIPWDPMANLPVRKGSWASLYEQVTGFNPDAANGGLQNDDLIDCVASSALIIKGKHSMRPQGEEVRKTPLERMQEGEVKDDYGNPLMHSVNLLELPADLVTQILNARKPESNRAADTLV